MNRGKRAAPEPKARHRFSMATLRGDRQPEISRKLYKMIKTENSVIDSYESAGRDRISVAGQLSEWGESTGDAAVSDISDKIGVVLAEIGEQEDTYAQTLEDCRTILKHIRNTENSVQPARDHKAKIIDEIQKAKQKDAGSKVSVLEQELVRAEAQALVAEAQLTNMTRQKFKESYGIHLAATIERAEKQIILARHGRRILNLLDDTPIVPGETPKPYDSHEEGKLILEEAEQELRSWEPTDMEPVRTAADEMGPGTLPARPREPMQQNGTGAGMGAGMGTGMGAGTGTGGGTGAGTGAGQEQYVDASDAPPQEFMYEKETLVVEPGEPGPQIAS